MNQKLFLTGILSLLLCAAGLCACDNDNNDEDAPLEPLEGSTWVITYDDSRDTLVGLQMTFETDGTLTLKPTYDWTYARWTQEDNTVTIILGEGEPDDYMQGKWTISGNSAKYEYSWYDYDGKWGGDELYLMKLRRQ